MDKDGVGKEQCSAHQDMHKQEMTWNESQHNTSDVYSVIKGELVINEAHSPGIKQETTMEDFKTALSNISTIIKEECIIDGSESTLTDVHPPTAEEVFLKESDHGTFIDESLSSDTSTFINKDIIVEESRYKQCVTGVADAAATSSPLLQLADQKSGRKKSNKTCDVCNKTFTRSNDLTRHRSVHSDVKEYCCDVCNRVLKSFTALTQHKLLHSTENSYKCGLCNETFRQASGLSKHKKIHGSGIIINFNCNVCNKMFTTQSNLLQHKETHSNKKVKCALCNRVFKKALAFSKHIIIHSGVRNYCCDICNKDFATANNLSNHKLIHSGIKKYQCGNDNTPFIQTSGSSQQN